MKNFFKMEESELREELRSLREKYAAYKEKDLHLDMTRGKPCPEQLDAVSDLIAVLDTGDYRTAKGDDCRNYGLPLGIREARELFAGILHTTADRVIVGNGSSLTMMHDTLVRSVLFGEVDSKCPLSQETKRKWICPVPGYDRHFLVTETLGFTMIPVALTEDGPDMDTVEKLVAEDSAIKGMWCTPLYSNPDGFVYSPEVCERLASMKTAAADFRIFWDNAYVVHHLFEDRRESIPDILALCEKAGNPNRVYEFASTSKITFPGSGISCMAANPDNIAHTGKYLSVQTIGPDKMNELRHVRYLSEPGAVEKIMKKHAEIIRPKFEITMKILERELEPAGFARWHRPQGGYFISLFVYPGTAKEVVALAKEAGVALTPAGATYPYRADPRDENIRIAPTFPTIRDVEEAIGVLCVCAKIAMAQKRTEEF